MQSSNYVITLVFIFLLILVSIQYTLNQILKTLREIKIDQKRYNYKVNQDKDEY